MKEIAITMFDSQNPCWTEELFSLIGEDPSALSELSAEGYLHFEDGVYSLTPKGVDKFNTLKAEYFIEGVPSAPPCKDESKLCAMRTKLALLLDISHSQRWGIKDIKTAVNLPFVPKINDDDIVRMDSSGFEWTYTSDDLYKKLADDFHAVLTDERNVYTTTPEIIGEWLACNGAEADYLKTDVTYLCRYDFMQYKDFKGHPNDTMKLINTDRFLFVFPKENPVDNLRTIGKFHLWLNYLRRMCIPGYVDRDTLEQDSVNWLIFTVESEKQAVSLAQEFIALGEELIANANPCEIWTLSFEALENLKDKRELVWELLPDIAHYAQRTLV